MSEFDSMLTRAFAEAHDEPADDGFTVKVGQAVAMRERAAQVRNAAYVTGMAAAGAAVLYAAYAIAGAFGQDLLASVGLEVARAHGALSGAEPVNTQGLMQTMSAGLSQILLVTAVLAGGAVAYRATQD